MTSHARLERMLKRRFRNAASQRSHVRNTGSPGSVHHLRVATRRLQEALDFLEPALRGKPRQRLRKRARQVRRSLGAIRNADVMLKLARELGRRLTTAQKRQLAPIVEHLRDEAASLRKDRRGRKLIAVPGLRKRIEKLGAPDLKKSGFSTAQRGREVLESHRRDLDAMLAAARTGRTKAVHALRIAVKRFRYALEILEESGVPHVWPAVARARALQTELGRLHDLDMLIALARSRRAGDASSIVSLLRRERREHLASALQAMDQLELPATIAMIEKSLSRGVAA